MIGQSIVDRLFPSPVRLHKAIVLVGRLLEIPAQELYALL